MLVDELQLLTIILLLVVPVVCSNKVDFIFSFKKLRSKKCSRNPFDYNTARLPKNVKQE